ncbi:DUF6314 family protein [Saccharopolyspora rosea]|uniref:DUF6314 family protein n=1 Tax=Saccharopolyspora rosea TaxID=524884 RepID=UPI0021D99520|nr:DUF6314 family protein [Saccharopolyspora rosea]
MDSVDAATGFPVTDLTAHFAGWWGVDREIVDPAGAQLAVFTGVASFTPDDDALVYRERGTLVMGENQASATRVLHYRLRGPGRADVHFDHGGFFHDLDLRTGRWSASHPCRADLYRVEFLVQDPDTWWQEWAVTGPAKSYTSTTEFRRRPAV